MQMIGNLGQTIQFYVFKTADFAKEYRNNPDFFQKAAQIILASFRIKMENQSLSPSLQRLVKVIDTANMHDLLGVIKDPYELIKTGYHSLSTLEIINKVNWLMVDMGCVTSFLRDWDLLNTAKIAASIGKYRGLNWVSTCHLDTCVIGLVCLGYKLNAMKAQSDLRRVDSFRLTSDEKSQLKKALEWDWIVNMQESALHVVILLNRAGFITTGNTNINLITIAVKSLGILALFMRPKINVSEYLTRGQS